MPLLPKDRLLTHFLGPPLAVLLEFDSFLMYLENGDAVDNSAFGNHLVVDEGQRAAFIVCYAAYECSTWGFVS